MADLRALFAILAVINGCHAVDSLRFLAMGDWGGIPIYPYDTPWEVAVARQMASVTERFKSSFNLALGDNFYENGVTDVDDQRFKYTFENVYHYGSLQNPWYLVAGNHDHYGNVSAQIAYSKKSKRWNFPNYYYALQFPIPGGKTVDILMLDTVLLCGNTGYDTEGDQPHGPENTRVAEDQWAWLEQKLGTSQADFILVTGHFPVYSIAEHGPTTCLVNRLKPLLHKYRVSAYFGGHDHNLQHISVTEGGSTVEYFVTGAANIVTESTAHKNDIPDGSLKFYWAKLAGLGGFSYIEATPQNMTVIFIDGLSTPLYKYSFLPRR